MLKNKHIYIFLNNKIMSCDTILPLMLEVKNLNSKINIHFISFDFKTYEFIKKSSLLNNVIEEIGYIKCLGRKMNSSYFNKNDIPLYNLKQLNIIPHFFINLPFFLKLLVNIVFNKTIFIHFRALNLWSLKILYYLNKRNTIFSNADSSGWSDKGYNADRAIHAQRIDPYSFKGPKPCGTKVIAFSKFWPFLQHPSLKKAKKYIISSSHERKPWIDYIKNNANTMMKKELNLPNNTQYYVLLIGHIGVEQSGAEILRKKDSWTTLIEDILDLIYDELPNLTVIIKPHIITDMDLLNKILNKRKRINTVISYLHPALLAVKAKFTIASHYTTAFQSISSIGGITIEYTDQKEEYAKKLNYKGKRPEYTSYFFNNDTVAFRLLLNQISANKIKLNLKEGFSADSTGIIKYLSN